GAAELLPFSTTAPASADVGTVSFAVADRAVTATLAGSKLALADHVASVLLIDATSGAPISLDYGLVTERTADGAGKLLTVKVPYGDKPIPHSVRAYLMIDVSPVADATLVVP